MTETQTIHKRILRLMGNRFEISVVADEGDSAMAQANIDLAITEIQRIEKLLTTYDENSQTNQVNSMAGISPVVVDREMFDLVERAIRIAELT